MVFDHIVRHPFGVAQTFLLVVVNRPMQSLTCWTKAPLLCRDCGKYWMFNREYECTTRREPTRDIPAYDIEGPNVVQRQRTNYDIELLSVEIDVFYCTSPILDYCTSPILDR